jgi:dihydropteroate synthase
MLIHNEIFPSFPVGDDIFPIFQGVINLSPESFYKGSFIKSEDVLTKINSFVKNGAKIIDIGARSTAPNVQSISREEELSRIKLILEPSIKNLPDDIAISIDTQYFDVADYCIKILRNYNRKTIVNDVSGLKTDPKLMDLVIDNDIPLILMASDQRPGDLLTVESIQNSFNNSLNELEKKGYNITKLILDPGIGKWIPEKTYEYDLNIIDKFESFRIFNQPLLVGISRKSFLGTILGNKPPEERYYGTLGASAIAVYNGAHILRTHDLNRELIDVIKTAYTLRKNRSKGLN